MFVPHYCSPCKTKTNSQQRAWQTHSGNSGNSIATVFSAQLSARPDCLPSPKVGDFNRGWDLDPLWSGRLHRLQTLSIHPLFPCLLKCGDSSSPSSIIQNMPTALWLSERLGKRLCTYIFLCARRLSCLHSSPGLLPYFHFLLFWHTQGRSKSVVGVSNIVHNLMTPQ